VPQRFGYFKLSVTAVSIFYAKVKKCSEWSQSCYFFLKALPYQYGHVCF